MTRRSLESGWGRTGSRTLAHVDFIRGAVAAGVQLIDTAYTYAGGQSEETIGTALSPIPDDVVVATKGGWNGARPEVLRAELEESLRRLRTDPIGLYYLHRVDPATPLEESLAAIEEARTGGKIRNVGVSNVGIDQIERARGVVPIAAVQNHYSLADRRTTRSSTTARRRASSSSPTSRCAEPAAGRSRRSPSGAAPRTRISRSRGS